MEPALYTRKGPERYNLCSIKTKELKYPETSSLIQDQESYDCRPLKINRGIKIS